MEKRLIGVVAIILILILIISLAYAYELDRAKLRKSPSLITSYPSRGAYKIDPETILTQLAQGKMNVFSPLLEDPNMVPPQNKAPYSWTQADFLQIASALGQFEWEDPMDLNDWSVYFVLFDGSCQDDPMGFDYADITYFKLVERFGKKVYTTRKIEIAPDYNQVVWGRGATFPYSVLNQWQGVDLLGANIAVEDTLRLAEEVAENDVVRSDTICAVYVSSPNTKAHGKWLLREGDFQMYIDMETGEYEVVDPYQE